MPLAIVETSSKFKPKYFDRKAPELTRALDELLKEQGLSDYRLRFPLDSQGKTSGIPYSLDADSRSVFSPSMDAYGFLASAVRGTVVDIERIQEEITRLVFRDRALYESHVRGIEDKSKMISALIQLRMVSFRGEEGRFNLSDEDIFFYHLPDFFPASQLYVDGEVKGISYGAEDILQEKLNFGNALYEALTSLPKRSKNSWLVRFGYDYD